MNVTFVSPEVSPFAKTGGLGDVSEALPIALNEVGANCNVIMPFYSLVRKNGFSPLLVKARLPLEIGQKTLSFDLFSIKHKETKFFFVHNDDLYGRDALYGTPKGDYEDNDLRFAFFAKAVLASILYMGMGKPDILHCNDWQSGLVPLYLKFLFKDFNKTEVLFTIHNMAYQGLFPKEVLSSLDIPENLFTKDGVEFYGKASFIKSGIVYSDAISTVSEGYSREMLTREFGCGLDDILRKRKDDVYGIINGADYSTWNPETDEFIIKKYSPESLRPKLECKKDLAKEFGIPFKKDTPLIGMITRLAHQKGVDLVAEAMGEILGLGMNFVILGTGDERYNLIFSDLSDKYKGRASAKIAFDERLAHKIEAGCDIFLIPSRYEPCGLNQMYSLKYGTVPIVRATGGLDDTIVDFDPETKEGNGFKFRDASARSMLEAIKRARDVFKDKRLWSLLQKNGMECDFSWKASARKYLSLYSSL